MVMNMTYHIETDKEEEKRVEGHYKENRELEEERRKMLQEVEAPVEIKGQVFKEWLEKKSGHVLSKKQHKLKMIGQPRHLAFDKWLYERFIREEWYRKGINYIVFDISMEDVDAIVFNTETWTVLEVYELTNYSLYRFGIPSLSTIRKLQRSGKSPYVIPIKDINNEWKNIFRKEKTRYYANPHSRVATRNFKRHKENLCKFNCKRYVVFSHKENLTETALWEYAKHHIMIKVLGYQD